MTTIYMKSADEHELVSISSGNRSRRIPDAPQYYLDLGWLQIDRDEAVKLKRKLLRRMVQPETPEPERV